MFLPYPLVEAWTMPFILLSLRLSRHMTSSIMNHLFPGDANSTHALMCHPGSGVAVVGQVKVPHCPLLGQDHQSNDTTRASIPLDRLLQGAPHEINTLLLGHLLLPVCVGIAVDVGRARTTDRERLLV